MATALIALAKYVHLQVDAAIVYILVGFGIVVSVQYINVPIVGMEVTVVRPAPVPRKYIAVVPNGKKQKALLPCRNCTDGIYMTQTRTVTLIIVLLVTLSACLLPEQKNDQSAQSAICPVTQPIETPAFIRQGSDAVNATSFGSAPIWTWKTQSLSMWYPAGQIKIPWYVLDEEGELVRDYDKPLHITANRPGERDEVVIGMGHPLNASIATHSSSLYFPDAGCWQVNVTWGNVTRHFVVDLAPFERSEIEVTDHNLEQVFATLTDPELNAELLTKRDPVLQTTSALERCFYRLGMGLVGYWRLYPGTDEEPALITYGLYSYADHEAGIENHYRLSDEEIVYLEENGISMDSCGDAKYEKSN